MSPYESGFSLPEGLRRHLLGWGGNVRQCSVMGAAVSLARDYWYSQFHSAEETEYLEKAEELRKRRQREVLFKTAPDLEPELIDEGIGYGDRPRSNEELSWAEKRLRSLQFTVSTDRKVKSYVREHLGFVVFADPREQGKITFNVFSEQYKARRGKPRLGWQRFYLRDNWKNDLEGKYETRVSQAITEIRSE